LFYFCHSSILLEYALLTDYATNRAAKETVVIAKTNVTIIEIQVAASLNIITVERITPDAAALTRAPYAAIASATSSRNEQCITILYACEQISIDTIYSCPYISTITSI
jgi:hypothetical protein